MEVAINGIMVLKESKRDGKVCALALFIHCVWCAKTVQQLTRVGMVGKRQDIFGVGIGEFGYCSHTNSHQALPDNRHAIMTEILVAKQQLGTMCNLLSSLSRSSKCHLEGFSLVE
jgi:hypothetical protein